MSSKTDPKIELLTRIDSVAMEYGLSRTELAKQSGVSPSIFSDLKNRDEGGISQKTLSKICQKFRVNPSWLLTGEGAMLEGSADPKKDELDRLWYALEEPRRGKVLDYVRFELAQQDKDISNKNTEVGQKMSVSYEHNYPAKEEGKMRDTTWELREPEVAYRAYERDENPGTVIHLANEKSRLVRIAYYERIAAGTPIQVDSAPPFFEDVPHYALAGGNNPDDFYSVTVVGDSMIEMGIRDGDLAVIRRQDTAETGDIVVARVNEGSTLKEFRRNGDLIELHPRNRNMKPIIVQDENFQIQGVMVSWFRQVKKGRRGR